MIRVDRSADFSNEDPEHVNDDRGYGAMPKLYGAPSYARPKGAGVDISSRPFDPDDLPLEAERTNLDQELVMELSATSYQAAASAGAQAAAGSADAREGSAMMRGRPFFLRFPGRGSQDGRG